jgi:hypothetical protein
MKVNMGVTPLVVSKELSEYRSDTTRGVENLFLFVVKSSDGQRKASGKIAVIR